MARLFEWLSLAALVCLISLGTARAAGLYARGIRVVVVDRGRSLAQALRDLLLVLLLLAWAYEIVAIAFEWELHLFPAFLRIALFESVVFKWTGVGVLAAGLTVYGLALRAMGDSWRLGIDRSAPGQLVERGVFAWSRNPIYLGLDLMVVGTFLVQGRLIFLGLALIIAAMLHEQIVREERFLRRTHGTRYRDYAARVGRYGSAGRRLS